MKYIGIHCNAKVMMDIIKTIIPAAGLGTRFLPYSALVPQELLPILNKPALQYVVEESIQSGTPHIILITTKGKEKCAELFSPSAELQMLLEERGKQCMLADLQKIARSAQVTYLNQPEPLGLGHAIYMARHIIHKEYFAVALPDDLIIPHRGEMPALAQMIRIARQENASVVAVQEVPESEISNYGCVGIKKTLANGLVHISNLVEKPDAKSAPSNLAIVGRYVLAPKIFKSLADVGGYATGELQLTDAIAHMLKHTNEKVVGYKIQGTRYDIGTPGGWIKAVLGMGIQDPVLGPHIQQFMQTHSFINKTTTATFVKKQ